MLMTQGALPWLGQSSWCFVGLTREGLVLISLWSHLVHGRVDPFLVQLSGTRVPHLQPHA